MKVVISIFFFFVSICNFAQSELDGVWQGFIVQNGKTNFESNPFFLEIETTDFKTNGLSREEINNTEFYGIGKLAGLVKNGVFEWKHIVYQKKVSNSKIQWCKLNSKLVFNLSTGYLEGNYTSTDCRNISGKIILFRSKSIFSIEKNSLVSQLEKKELVKNIAENRPSPEIRESQRLNFTFKFIYFDYDKAFIRSVDIPFLNEIVEVVEGHSDLRIKVIGNTDADGSDFYNEQLSKRRAEAIIDFFVNKGLAKDRIEIQFNGEKKPIDSNQTSEGKQKNRRVEFQFI